MKKAKKNKMLLLVTAIVIEIAAVIMIAKAIATDSFPTTGLTFLAIGLFFLVLGMQENLRKARRRQADNKSMKWSAFPSQNNERIAGQHAGKS